jgi:hypothetical protein
MGDNNGNRCETTAATTCSQEGNLMVDDASQMKPPTDEHLLCPQNRPSTDSHNDSSGGTSTSVCTMMSASGSGGSVEDNTHFLMGKVNNVESSDGSEQETSAYSSPSVIPSFVLPNGYVVQPMVNSMSNNEHLSVTQQQVSDSSSVVTSNALQEKLRRMKKKKKKKEYILPSPDYSKSWLFSCFCPNNDIDNGCECSCCTSSYPDCETCCLDCRFYCDTECCECGCCFVSSEDCNCCSLDWFRRRFWCLFDSK